MVFDTPITEPMVQGDEEEQPQWLREVMSLYRCFDENTSGLLMSLYSDDVVFKDPLHEMRGILAVQDYFEHIGSGLLYCDFTFRVSAVTQDCAWLKWTMQYAHPRLKNGKDIVLYGATELVREQKIVAHTDYYDVGAMIYEHVPVLGFFTQKIKQRLVP